MTAHAPAPAAAAASHLFAVVMENRCDSLTRVLPYLPERGVMSDHTWFHPTERRSFLARLGTGIGIVGAAVAGAPGVEAQAPAGGRTWAPTRHPQDDWLDRLPGGHRFVFDTTSA